MQELSRFVELTIRRGSSFKSLEKRSKDDLRCVLVAFSSYLPDNGKIPAGAAMRSASEFLSGAGFWLEEKPIALLLSALRKGLILETDGGYQKAFTAPYTREALDEAVFKEEDRRQRFRENVRQVLQKRNREINSRQKLPPTNDEFFMLEALEYAKEAYQCGEVPVGCVIVLDGQIIGAGANGCVSQNDPSAHAEVVAIRKAARSVQNYRLSNAVLYVTLEPCPMCASLISNARIARVVYGASDPKSGAFGGAFNLLSFKGFNHRPVVIGKVLAPQCAGLLQKFFSEKRSQTQSTVQSRP